MDTIFEKSVEKVLKAEGYLSTDKKDLGNKNDNYTIWGLSTIWHPQIKKEDWLHIPKKRSRERAITVYYNDYWLPSVGKLLPLIKPYGGDFTVNLTKLIYIVFDAAVQYQPRDAIKLLQEAINKVMSERQTLFGTAPKFKLLKVDGVAGEKTRRGVASALLPNKNMELLWAYKTLRLEKYLHVIEKDHDLARFAGGWANRIEKF